METIEQPEVDLRHLDQKKYQFKQRTRSLFKFQMSYEITNPDSKEHYFYAKRDRLWFKKDLKMFYGDSDEGEEFVFMKDNSIFDVFGSFTIFDSNQTKIGHAKRKFWRSFFARETWEFYGVDGTFQGKIQARGNLLKNYVRKLRIIPIFSAFMRLQFEFINNEGIPFAEFSRKVSLRDFYILEFLENRGGLPVDKRTIIAMSVLLDAAQGR